MKSKNDNPWIIKESKNAKNSNIIVQDPNNENAITLYRSDGKENAQFTYTLWFVIENMEYKYGDWKHMFHKGNKTADPNKAPGVFIHPETNSIRIFMNTLQNIDEYVDIEDIPIKKWVRGTARGRDVTLTVFECLDLEEALVAEGVVPRVLDRPV